MSALSVEPRGVAALPEGFPEDASHGSNVRAGLSAHASRTAEDLAQPPHEAELLARLLQQARVTQYADLISELGAQSAADLSTATAQELAPMPIFHAKRLIRCAAEAVAESEAYDQDRVEREMRDADRAAEAEAKQEGPPFDGASAEDRERARMAADDDDEIGRDARPDYRSNLPFGTGSSIRRSADGRLHFRRPQSSPDVARFSRLRPSRLPDRPEDRRYARMSLGTDAQPELMTEGDSPLAQVLREVLTNTADPLHRQTCDLEILYRSLHQMTDVEESRMLKTAESVARDKSIKSLNRAEVSAGSSSLSSEKIDLDPDEISRFRVALTNAAQQNHLPSFFPYLHRLLEHPTVASGTFSFARHCPTIQTRVSRFTDAQFLKPLLHAVGPRVRSMLVNMQVESCMDGFAILMRMTGTGSIRRAKVLSSLVHMRADTMDARLLLPSAIEQRERELGELGQNLKPEDKLMYLYSALSASSGSVAASAQGIYELYRDGVVPLERTVTKLIAICQNTALATDDSDTMLTVRRLSSAVGLLQKRAVAALDSSGASVDRLSVRRTPQHRHPRGRTRRLECHNCGEPHYVVDKETGQWSCPKDPDTDRLASNLQKRVDRSKNSVLTKRCKDTQQVVIAVKSKPVSEQKELIADSFTKLYSPIPRGSRTVRATTLFDELIEDERRDSDADDDANDAHARLHDAERWSDAGLSGDDSDHEDFRAEGAAAL